MKALPFFWKHLLVSSSHLHSDICLIHFPIPNNQLVSPCTLLKDFHMHQSILNPRVGGRVSLGHLTIFPFPWVVDNYRFDIMQDLKGGGV